MKFKTKKAIVVISVICLIMSIIAVSSQAMYFLSGGGVWNTYINASSPFSSSYYTNNYPDIGYQYMNLLCDTQGAKMSVTLYAKKIKWYSIFAPSEESVGTVECKNLNGELNVWYGTAFHDVDCASVSEIQAKYSMSLDESPSLRFYYDISNNNSKPVHNSYGEWQVNCSY